MAKYVDVEAVSSGTGTTESPWTLAQAESLASYTGYEDIKIKGKGNVGRNNWFPFDGSHGCNSVSKWENELPAILTLSSGNNLELVTRDNQANPISEIIIKAINILIGCASTEQTFINCTFIGSETISNFNNNTAKTVNFKGCSFINNTETPLSPSYSAFMSAEGVFDPESGTLKSARINCNSCYFDGKAEYLVALYKNGGDTMGDSYATFTNCAMYNNSSYVALVQSIAGDPSGNITSNSCLWNPGSASQLNGPLIVTASLLNIPTALRPKTSSTLIDAGNASLGLSTDIFGVTRTYNPNPDIGAAEYVTASGTISVDPTSWSFGSVSGNSTTDKTVSISNTGEANLTIGAMTGLSVPYSLRGDLSGNIISPLDSSDFAIRYNPTSVGITNQTLTINSNDLSTPAYIFNIDGTYQSMSYFDSSVVLDGTAITSYVDSTSIVSAIQASSPDTYFNSTSKIYKILTYYRDNNGRQSIRVVQKGTNLSGPIAWNPGATDGTWEKYRVIVFDSNGARHDLGRNEIGPSEDLIHIDGTTILNVG